MDGPDDFFSKNSELVLGVVAPVGTDLDDFISALTVALQDFGYEANQVRMSKLAEALTTQTQSTSSESYAEKVERLMTAGDTARAFRRDVLALAAAVDIQGTRTKGTLEHDSSSAPKKRAYVVRSLKHPSEVHALRRIYGPGFYLVGVVTSEEQREAFLRNKRGCKPNEISELFARDEHGRGVGGDAGQRTRATFQLADAFIRLDDVAALRRFLSLVFGHPHETPTPDEYAMFLAFSAALRSADLSRQVGAVITTAAGDVVAIGTNDVPIAGGGLCWPGPLDHRDHAVGCDTNERERGKIVDEILDALIPDGTDAEEWRARGWKRLAKAAVMDITEYGRPVHAEMEALLSCARSGIGTRGSALYSTTFPCHNCAKHIIAAAVARVVFVEPYPKSRAKEFYPESIHHGPSATTRVPSVDGSTPSAASAKVRFEPFVGIGPRRFIDLFSVGLSSGFAIERKVSGGGKRGWDPSTATVRVPLLYTSYFQREAIAAELLQRFTSDSEIQDEKADPKQGD